MQQIMPDLNLGLKSRLRQNQSVDALVPVGVDALVPVDEYKPGQYRLQTVDQKMKKGERPVGSRVKGVL